MIQGVPVDPRHVVRFTDYLLMLLKTSPNDPTAMAFGKYLKSWTKQSPDSMSAEKVAEHLLATESDPFFSEFQGMLDSFRAKITDAVTGKAFINCYTRRCEEEDLVDASRWLYAWAANDLYPRKKFRSTDEAMAATETAIGLMREEFVELARQWRAYDEWTVVLAQGRYSPTGMTVVLPLVRKAYEAVREGELDLQDICSSDLCRPSRDFLVVAIAQRPESLGGDCGNSIKNVFAAHVSQVAILSAYQGTGSS